MSGLELVPVGVGAAHSRVGERQSCTLLRSGDTAVAVDLGSGALDGLRRHVAPEALGAVLLTHLHADHCVDLMALHVRLAFGPGRGHRVDVHGPPGTRERMVAFSGGSHWDEVLAHRDLVDGVAVAVGSLTIRPAEVPHLPPTFALRVEGAGRVAVLSADCRPSPALVELARGADLLLCECTFGAGEEVPGVPHMTAAQAGETARAAGVGRLLLNHCEPPNDPVEAVRAAAAAFGGPVSFAVQDELVAV